MFSGVRTRIGALCAALALVVLLATPAHAAGKTVHITKSDSAGNAVQGATFTLYVDAAPVGGGPPKGAEDTTAQGTCTTGANGQCDITDVPPGNYWVSETGPPAGYVAAADSTLEVKRGKKKVFEVVVVDDKKPSNTSVNDPTGDELAQDGTHIFQFGPSVAVSPNGKQVGVAFNDSAGFFSDASAIGWAFSNDRGRSWRDLGQVPSNDEAFVLAQPSVVFDPSSGAFVVASQGAIPVDQDLRRPVLVSRYDPQSGTWTPLVDTFPELAVGSSAHDPWLAVDSSPSSPYEGRMYLGFTVSNGDGQAQGFLSRSGNGGRTWSDPVAVTDLGTNDFLNPSVAPDGRVYVTWADFTAAAAATNDIYVSRSTDGGRTFSRPFPVATDVQKGGAPTSCGGSTQYAYLGGIGSGSPPRLAIDPADPGRIFIAFAGGTGADTGDVFVSESRDHGETWRPVVPLGDPAGIQMFPDIEVTPDGRIGVSYYQASSPSQIDFVTSFLDGFGPTLSGSLHATVPVTDDPFSLWDVNPSVRLPLRRLRGAPGQPDGGSGIRLLRRLDRRRRPGPRRQRRHRPEHRVRPPGSRPRDRHDPDRVLDRFHGPRGRRRRARSAPAREGHGDAVRRRRAGRVRDGGPRASGPRRRRDVRGLLHRARRDVPARRAVRRLRRSPAELGGRDVRLLSSQAISIRPGSVRASTRTRVPSRTRSRLAATTTGIVAP